MTNEQILKKAIENMNYKPTKEEKDLVSKINKDYSDMQEFKKKNPHLCGCWRCQVGEFVKKNH